MTDWGRLPFARLLWPGGEIVLHAGQTVRLGRSIDNDVLLDDPQVSRQHALVEWRVEAANSKPGFCLRDLGSANGTLLNDVRMDGQVQPLQDGDEIRVSSHSLRFVLLNTEPDDFPTDIPAGGVRVTLTDRGPTLEVIAGPDMGQVYPLWGERVTVGRASREATWEIRLTDRSISRPHARLERRADGYYLLDLGSANGTLLNGRPVGEGVRIEHSDRITVGDTCLVFRD